MNSESSFARSAFTLLEVLLVVGLLAILVGIIILAMNPNRQGADARNAQRRIHANTILNALVEYRSEHGGIIPEEIPLGSCNNSSLSEICHSSLSSSTCALSGLVYLGELIKDERYLSEVPTDPGVKSSSSTGFGVVRDEDGKIVVCALLSEQSDLIQVSK